MNNQIITLYTKGLRHQEIVKMFKAPYDAAVSIRLISWVTDVLKNVFLNSKIDRLIWTIRLFAETVLL